MNNKLTRRGSITILALTGAPAAAGLGYAAIPTADGVPARRRVGLVAVAVCLAVVALLPASAAAQGNEFPVPTLSAVAGQSFTASGMSANSINDSCSNLRNVEIDWNDGGPRTAVPGTLVDFTRTTVDGQVVRRKRVAVTGTRVFPGGPFLAEVKVSYEATCVIDDQPVVARRVDEDIFNVQVSAGLGGSCPLGQTASLVRMSQASCPIHYSPSLGKAQKVIFRKLAKIAYDGLLVDRAIDGVISAPEDFIAEKFVGKGIIREFVISKFWGKLVVDKLIEKLPKHKVIPYGWMLDAPKYAGYLDLVKYTVLNRLANDPPDPNFTALASPPKLRSLRGAPRQVGRRDRREAGLYIALLTTVERAGGAQVAGNLAAESRQLRHASGIANQLVSLLGAKQKAVKAAARMVKRISSRRHRLPRGIVGRAKRGLGSESFTRFARKALSELGFTADEMKAVAADVPAVPIKRFTRPFAKVLGLSAEAKAIRDERAALATFAKRHALGR